MTKHVKPGWALPNAPAGFAIPTVVLIQGRWFLDFSKDQPRRLFARDTGVEKDIPWPWVDGFAPGEADWLALGFSVAVIGPLPCSGCGRDLYDDSPVLICAKCDPEFLKAREPEFMDIFAAALYGHHFAGGGRTVQ